MVQICLQDCISYWSCINDYINTCNVLIIKYFVGFILKFTFYSEFFFVLCYDITSLVIKMLVYGKNVLKDLDKKKIKKVYCARKDYQDYLEENKIHYEMVDNKRLDKMVNGLHQGIVIDMYDFQYSSIDDLEGNFIVILDHIEDPHNFGAIIRTCEAAGVNGIIIPKDRSVEVNSTVVKVSTGTCDKVNIVQVTNLNNTIKYLKDKGYIFKNFYDIL